MSARVENSPYNVLESNGAHHDDDELDLHSLFLRSQAATLIQFVLSVTSS